MRPEPLPGCYSRHTVVYPEHEFRYFLVTIPGTGRTFRARCWSREVIGQPAWTTVAFEGADGSGCYSAEHLHLEPVEPFTPEEHRAADEHLERIKPVDWW